MCLDGDVGYRDLTTGLERYRLPYNALTQTNLDEIDLSAEFLGAHLRAPILVGAMTGGAQLSGTINRNLAGAAQQLGIGMMLGSQRVMLNSVFGERAAASFSVRDVAPDVLLFGNIGLSQLTKDAVPDIVAALDRVGANALAVHTNPLQEAVQHNGDTDFAGSLDRLHDVSEMLGYPVLLKEVGHGIGATAVAELLRLTGEPPVAAIDVAGAGGTSWSRVEQLVRYGEVRYPDLADWGIPTAQAVDGGAGGASAHPVGCLRRNPNGHGRGQSAGFGCRRGGRRPAAVGGGDRVRGCGDGLAAAIHRRASHLPARVRHRRSACAARRWRDAGFVTALRTWQ